LLKIAEGKTLGLTLKRNLYVCAVNPIAANVPLTDTTFKRGYNLKDAEIEYGAPEDYQLNRHNFLGAFDNIYSNIRNEANIGKNHAKCLYFFISEAARFATARVAVDEAFRQIHPVANRAKWIKHSPILHAWNKLVGDVPAANVGCEMVTIYKMRTAVLEPVIRTQIDDALKDMKF